MIYRSRRNSNFWPTHSYGMLIISVLIFGLFDVAFAQETFVKIGQQPLNVKAADNASSNELAIVSTWRGTPLTWANSWLRYHIAIGFTRIYLFFDDPKHDKEVIDALSNAPEYKEALTIVKVDKKYRKKYWTLEEGGPNLNSEPEQWLLPAFGVHVKTEHTARQILNVARAGLLAKADNIAWLLHIDADEVFWLKGLKSGAAKSFFAQLTNRRVTHAIFFNDEVAPKTADYKSKKLPRDPFHQRLFFKRNEMALNEHQLSLVQKWQKEKDIRYFLGYMCGKGAINVALWRQNFGDKSPILPQHVVSFAFHYYQPGNVTVINSDPSKLQPYISSKKIKIACFTNDARVLHYVNPEFDSMLKKFAARKKFNTDIFDLNLVAKKHKDTYKKYEKYWIRSEKMPSWKFYNEMWTLVRQGLKANNNDKALKFYVKGALTQQGKNFKQYFESGLVYKNKHVMEFVREISKFIEKKGKVVKSNILLQLASGQRNLQVGDGKEVTDRMYPLHGCKDKAPHFQCDVENCCGLLKWPQFTFTKRLLGYKRYQAMEWWKPGLKWP